MGTKAEAEPAQESPWRRWMFKTEARERAEPEPCRRESRWWGTHTWLWLLCWVYETQDLILPRPALYHLSCSFLLYCFIHLQIHPSSLFPSFFIVGFELRALGTNLYFHVSCQDWTLWSSCRMPVTQAHNPSYSGSRDQEDHGSKPAWLWDPISKKKPITRKGWPSSSRYRPWVQTLVPQKNKTNKKKTKHFFFSKLEIRVHQA
jgi:hypothetical protein